MSPVLVTYVIKNKSDNLRFGITTGKKVGKAVKRTRARRVIRAAYYQLYNDLKPGYDMAKACGVPFACAGWSDNQIPVVREYMQKYCDYYLKTTAELEKILYKD